MTLEQMAIQHIAMTVCPSESWEEVLMLTCAFDASGHQSNQLCLVVAGFVSSAKDWIDFSAEWQDRLDRDAICYFHMVEFAHSVKQFKRWKDQEKRRQTLFSDLLGLIKKYAYRKFGCAIINDTFHSNISSANQNQLYLNSYSMAARSSVAQVGLWAKRDKISSPSIEYVFEDGDVGKGLLVQRMVEDCYPAPIFRPKKVKITPEGQIIPAFLPLQAADILAYEMFKAVREMEESGSYRLRWGLEEFHRMPGEPWVYKVDNLKEFDDIATLSHKIDQRASQVYSCEDI